MKLRPVLSLRYGLRLRAVVAMRSPKMGSIIQKNIWGVGEVGDGATTLATLKEFKHQLHLLRDFHTRVFKVNMSQRRVL